MFIVGPTAIGKTRLAVVLAKKIHGEIISCDSMQVYRGMRILSQSPSKKERALVKHHLVGILDPKKEYSAAVFIKRAMPLIEAIINRKRIPIVAGGSGLYVKALVDGLFLSPEADMKFRKRMQAFVSRHGSKKLHERLAKIDSISSGKIHPNDVRRIIRALEIFESTGRTMTELKSTTRGLKDLYDIRIFGLIAPREKIYSRIDSRVDEMFAFGAVVEAKRLARKRMSKTAREVLGFKEIADYLDGEYDLEYAKGLVKMNTRRFAKRQLTWFRPDKRIKWYDITRNTGAKIVNKIMKEVR
ncbi:MAG: tRNA (adenosine(37)-N6)-dimethylallyltransferase MiaA [Candidatus Omnitrophica bacterium]|nr:tRNA (adenosine(37)-N6)-dimethylallyltransferase MiaA [Candidatus Omnitrophota bacterium]